MQRWRVRVVHVGEPEATFDVTPRVVVDFERFYKTGIGKAFADEQRLEHVYWLAWTAERHAGTTVPPFDAWLATVLDVELETGDTPLDESPSPT